MRYKIWLVLVLFLLVFFPFQVWAIGELLPAGQVIGSDFLRTGQIVQVDGEIEGDAFLAGGLVTVNGVIHGDLFVLGGKVTVNGRVGNSIRIVGGDVTVNSQIGRNALLVCGNCTVTKQAVIDGSLLATGANMEVGATRVGRGLRFLGHRLYLDSEVAHEAFVVANREFILGPQASISGSLKYSGEREVQKHPHASIAGSVDYQKTLNDGNYPRFFGARQILDFYEEIEPLVDLLGFSVTVLIGFLLLGLFPRVFEKTAMAMENQPTTSLGVGLALALGLPAAIILFAITIVGLPVSAVLFLVGYVCWFFTQYLTAFFVGRKIMLPKFGERRGWAILLGLLLIWLLEAIPFVGQIIKAFLIIFTLGAAVLAYKQPEIVRSSFLREGNRRQSGR